MDWLSDFGRTILILSFTARVKTHLFPRAALQSKSLAGQEKGEERIGNTVEPFDEPGGDFRCNPEGRGPFDPWRCCSSLMIV
jgi:hypothetical protein